MCSLELSEAATMEYIANTTEFQLHNTAVALGKFEGLHRGHNLLLLELYKYHDQGLKSVMLTFDLPPKAVINNEYDRVIYTKEERKRILEQTPLKCLVEYPFTPEFARLTPEEFVKTVLVGKFGAKRVVVGADFHFGYKRSGNVEILKELSEKYGYELTVIPKLQDYGMDVSSSRIRKCLSVGNMEEANRLLGLPPFTVYGEVIHGKKLGSSILEMPTANQVPPANKYLPPNGVYVSRIIYKDKIYYGISNIGVKPTVDDHIEKGLETYIFDFNEDLYGAFLEVQLLYYVRPEQKFASMEELKEQMNQDADFGRRYVQNLKTSIF